jgi:hypothetical protein
MRRIAALTAVVALTITVTLHAQSPATISLQERVTMASQIYHIVSTFFPGLSQDKFDVAYQQYLSTALREAYRVGVSAGFIYQRRGTNICGQ